MHPVGEPVFFTYKITDSSCVFLAGLEPNGTVNPAGFDPITYYNGDIIYSEYPKTFVRINVTNPATPYVTAKLVNDDFDVCKTILPYEDTLLITSRQCGSAFWDGNFRLIKNNVPDTLISLGKYGTSRYSYTAGITNIGSILFTAHSQGLVVFDISDFIGIKEETDFTVQTPGFDILKAYPNPFFSYTRLQGYENKKVIVYNACGEMVGEYPGSKIGDDLCSGIFFIKTGEQNRMIKMIKLH